VKPREAVGVDLARELEANWVGVYRQLCAAVPGATTREIGGLALVATGVPIHAFNVGMAFEPLADAPAVVSGAIGIFDGAEVPFLLIFRSGVDPAAEQAAADHGLPVLETFPGMALSPVPEDASSKAIASGLDIREVADERTLADFHAVLAAGFGLPLDAVAQVLGLDVLGSVAGGNFVGYAEDRPATVSVGWMEGRTVGVFNVATLDDFRRRGFGEAMTWRAAAAGAESGAKVAVLQASEMGRPIYERMGFRTVASYVAFGRPPTVPS
jgi:ribosomal protein S18 acetylase RimI-like enzyme